jgi:uncharacterized protein
MMSAGLPVLEMSLALVAVMVGSLIQGAIGSGFAFAATPAMVLILPESVPVTLLVLSLPMAVLMALRERKSIDGRGFLWITAGRFPGTFAGAGVLLVIPAASLGVVFGALILIGVAMSVLSGGFEVRRATQFSGGVASGIMGTVAGMGSPPLALVYQSKPGGELRSTLAVSFVVGISLSLVVLAFLGEVKAWHLLFALGLSPGMLFGLWASGLVKHFVDKRWLRPAILAFAAVSSAVAIAEGLLS